MGVVELSNQALQTLGFFDGVEVFALDVFNQCQRQRVFIIDFFNQYRDFGQASNTRSAVAAFARDDFVSPIANGAHDDGLHESLLFDGVGQFIECAFIYVTARLVFTRL